MSRAFIPATRVALVNVALLLGFGVLLARLFHLHVWEQPDLLKFVEENRKMFQVIPARRGDLLDTRGNLLATSSTTRTVGLDPQTVDDSSRDLWPDLARLAGIPLASVEEAVARKTRPGDRHDREVRLVRWVKLAEGIDETTYEAIEALGIRGVYGNRHYTRAYPAGRLASHVLGFVNKEGTAVTGAERVFDYYLRGQNGWRETERDGRRRELARFREREVEPADGLGVQLTLDQTVQHVIETEMDRLVREFAPAGISIIVSEPASGAVLGLANYPDFDPNRFWEEPVDAHRNRAVSDLFEPGSTFKIVPAAAALNEGVVAPSDVFETGVERVSFRGRTLRLPGDHHHYDRLSVHDIVVKSSNRGAAWLGLTLGEDRLHAYAQAFGFGQKTGLDLVGEIPGILHPVKEWDGLTITRLPMGHAVSATPMQVHCAMSVVANRGVLMEPRVARRVFDAEGRDLVRFPPEARHRVVSSEVADTLTGMLIDVAGEEGTARQAALEGYEVAGKTGTTQKIIDGRYSRTHHVASFTGFFPARNPALVITVVVDDPQLSGVGYGGRVAAPAFQTIARELIAYLGIPPSRPDDAFLAYEKSLDDWTRRPAN